MPSPGRLFAKSDHLGCCKRGVKFLERVTDGELVVEGLEHLAPVDRQKLQANWNDVRNELLPVDQFDSIPSASSKSLALS